MSRDMVCTRCCRRMAASKEGDGTSGSSQNQPQNPGFPFAVCAPLSRSAINSGPVGAGKDVPISKPRLRFQRTVTTSTGQASPERLVPGIGGGNEIEDTEDASDVWFGKSRPEMGGVWSGRQIGRRSIRCMHCSIHFELQLLHVQIPGI